MPDDNDPASLLPNEVAAAVAERAAAIAAHARVRASEPYLSEWKHIQRLTFDFVKGVHACVMMGRRAPAVYDQMLLFRSAEDVFQSALAALSLVDNGFINPVQREVRYLIESAVKALHVDQSKPAAPLGDRIAFLHAEVDRSGIEVVERVTLCAFDQQTRKAFANEVTDLFYKQCAYVHPSKQQIEEQIALAAAGKSVGFESADELRRIGRTLFRAYDMVLTLFLHDLGLGLAGDVFVHALDAEVAWKFHKGKYTSLVSSTFDYKAERRSRRP